MEFDISKRHCYFFNELSKIPHGSFNEAAAIAWVREFALNLGLEPISDEWGNTIVRKPGSPGHENDPWLMLQGHIDMVMSTMDGVEFDWDKDPLDLYVEDGKYLRARGTTLGADDGVAIAYMMAILEDDTLVHPPLECVFTVAEETGLDGAVKMKPEDILSRRVINIDGGDEYATMCCSSGGIKGKIRKTVHPVKAEGKAWRMELKGYIGGHSGVEIDKGFANPVTLCARFLAMVQEKTDVVLCDYHGGYGDNVIPQQSAVIFRAADEKAMKEVYEQFEKEVLIEFKVTDPQGYPSLTETEYSTELSAEETAQIIDILMLAPNGVYAMDDELDTPITSNNVGKATIENDELVVAYRIRSQLEGGLDDMQRRINHVAALCGASVELLGRYPGWNYERKSHLREIMNELTLEVYGKELIVEGCHAGTENGVWYALNPGTDILAIGAIEEYIHTPYERLNLAAFDRMYDMLVKLIARISEDDHK
ncbi:MAG: beta-Ala-His dipeptidase [Erysipelotrichaceae bacterium]|nr:beta-Ala-His dipeptidase [Erysipelotrichaceae bacterium]